VVIAVRMIPPEVMIDARAKAEEVLRTGKPVSWVGAVIIAVIWIVLAGLAIWLVWRLFNH